MMRALFRSLVLLVSLLALGAQATTIRGLHWDKDNDASGSDIRLIWDGANFLPRESHTVIFKYNPRQQTGYYTVWWHSPNTGSWDGGIYSHGTHPWPGSDCQVNGQGQALNGTGSAGTAHCWEIAGTGLAVDYLATAGTNPGYTVVKSAWYTQARRVRSGGSCGGGVYEHTYFLDLENNPSLKITVCLASISGAGSTPAFYLGASDWTVSGSTNNETLGGKIRGIQMYDAGLSDADILTEAANATNTPQTVDGLANVWYMNQDPTVADVTDKSGEGHNPTWANANRPADWDSTYGGAPFRGTLLGVGK